jgi:hypothetical protein
MARDIRGWTSEQLEKLPEWQALSFIIENKDGMAFKRAVSAAPPLTWHDEDDPMAFVDAGGRGWRTIKDSAGRWWKMRA